MGFSALNYLAVIESAVSGKEQSSHCTWVCQHFCFSVNSRFISVTGGEQTSSSETLVVGRIPHDDMSRLPLCSGLDTKWMQEMLAWEEESHSFTRRGCCITISLIQERWKTVGLGHSQLLPKLPRDSITAANTNVIGIGQHARRHYRK